MFRYILIGLIPIISYLFATDRIHYIKQPVTISIIFSLINGFITYKTIPSVASKFILKGLSGKDLNKKDQPIIAECLGLICSVFFLINLYCFIPVPFTHNMTLEKLLHLQEYPHIEFVQFLSGILSIQAMVLLGFCDDVFDIRWRYKIFLPSIASIPMLMVYSISDGVTTVVLPYPLKSILGNSIDLGFLYYFYMIMMATFCTNAVNIVAGINGVEVGQTLVLAISVIIFNITHLDDTYSLVARHLFSLYMLIPFVGVSIPLLLFNKYPARVFVGDTYCYFGGMVLAVVGVLGHFSKTILLFFGPQIFNFILSSPQLFRLIPCPRHRMPKLNLRSGKLEPSETEFKDTLKIHQTIILNILSSINVIKLTRDPKTQKIIKSTNFTILNALLVIFGPLREDELFFKMMLIQASWSLFSFGIRYIGIQLFYPKTV